ncbi:MAG: phosphatidylglycerophosphatase A [Steroidobacteraceae bacterium]
MTAGQKRGPLSPALLRQPVHFFAFGFGAGLSPVAPGTAGTLIAVPIVWSITQISPWALAVFAVLAAIVGIYICGESARRLGVHDHSGIVWDEITGYALTLAPVVPDVWSFVLGFALFRVFDILKPWPIREADHRLHGGLGIMLDDVLAGIFSGAILFTLRAYF